MPPHHQHQGSDICAIFVHAGAGYHSVANEKLHLGAVNDAAKVGMAVLRNGGDAIDAVEMAIRLLEDREITNAGYGSNLTIEGHVECDATMVDYLGRSGAVGAVSHVKNPIALARVVLEASSKPLSLQRVPPNLIVGAGATDFAADHGIPILPHDYLISGNARSRWFAWRQDLFEASEAEQQKQGKNNTLCTKLLAPKMEILQQQQQPLAMVSPSVSPHNLIGSANHTQTLPTDSKLECNSPQEVSTPNELHESDSKKVSRHAVDPSSYHQYAKVADWACRDLNVGHGVDDRSRPRSYATKRQRLDGSNDEKGAVDTIAEQEVADVHWMPLNSDDDRITDTVGCIAIDCFGHIAAGSSSGGIGMKHRGRCGPAALVGVGTAVIPVDPEDPEQTCVATVTSGTGEHMATTSAASTAADRIYLQVKREGTRLRPCDEDEALRSMIKNDFMKHPGVRNQPCVGAIGILAVKKTKDGIYFYFGHNTDSFAIASMHSEEQKPVCTMSRSKGHSSIAQGGRAARGRRAKHG